MRVAEGRTGEMQQGRVRYGASDPGGGKGKKQQGAGEGVLEKGRGGRRCWWEIRITSVGAGEGDRQGRESCRYSSE